MGTQCMALSADRVGREPGLARPEDFFGASLILTETCALIGANGDASSSPGMAADPNDSSMLASGAIYMYTRVADALSDPFLIKADKPHAYDAFTGAAYNDDAMDSGALHVFR